jgi:putative ABC transport system ATP-binding protein
MICLENVTKTYTTTRGAIKALTGTNLRVEKGEFVVICGPSGSGKTTLLMAIAAMLRPTTGTIFVEQHNLYAMSGRARAKFRAQNIGFVFQEFALVPYLTLAENIALAAGPIANGGSCARALDLIDKFGLSTRSHHKPAELSVGEKQRTAVARALMNKPKIVLADEPTGNLDSDNAATVLADLADFNQAGGTVLLVTHGPTAEQHASRMIRLQQGRIM